MMQALQMAWQAKKPMASAPSYMDQSQVQIVQQQVLAMAARTPAQQDEQRITYFWDFTKVGPPSYGRAIDDIVTEEWVNKIRKLLEALHFPDDGQRVRLAPLTFTGNTETCWHSVMASHDVDQMS